MPKDFALIASLISLGFFGGFSHCIGMCGPFVITQVSNRLEKVSLQDFGNFERLKNYALIPYQFGRIFTYSFIGFFCSIAQKNIGEATNFENFSAIILLLAALSFFFTFKSPNLQITSLKNLKIISALFLNPRGFNGFKLGLILGFIPCGLLYSAFLISASFSEPFLAWIGMILFGLSTFPSLFVTGCGSGLLQRFPEFKFISRALILVNGVVLTLMSIKLIIN